MRLTLPQHVCLRDREVLRETVVSVLAGKREESRFCRLISVLSNKICGGGFKDLHACIQVRQLGQLRRIILVRASVKRIIDFLPKFLHDFRVHDK